MSTPERTVTWTCSDGLEISGTVFETESPAATTVIAPAMGVPSGFYARFARYLSENGIAAITFDYRGVGTPMDRPVRLSDWGRLDLEAILGSEEAGKPLFLVGHSAGGQLVGLAPSCKRLDGMVLVAAQSGHWRHWSGLSRLGMWLLWYLVVPVLTLGRKRFPSRVLGIFPVDIPAGVVREWARWGRCRRYLFQPELGLDTSRYGELDIPILAYGFEDDGYAPGTAIDVLLAEYPAADVERRQIAPKDRGLKAVGHFGFFREKSGGRFWSETVGWIRRKA